MKRVKWLNKDFIELKEIAENDSWFSDNPDVVEVDELIQKWSDKYELYLFWKQN